MPINANAPKAIHNKVFFFFSGWLDFSCIYILAYHTIHPTTQRLINARSVVFVLVFDGIFHGGNWSKLSRILRSHFQDLLYYLRE